MPEEERVIEHGRAVAPADRWHSDDQDSIRALLDEALRDNGQALSTILALVVQGTSAIVALAAATGTTPDSYLQALGPATADLGYDEPG